MPKIYVIGVSKTWWNRGNVRHRKPRNVWMGFFWDDTGRFFSKRLSTLEAMALKLKVTKVIKGVCLKCGSKFNTLKDFVMDYADGTRKCPLCGR